ncbi:hypothetical protein GJ697_22545 [Pseudoduganella sp. FT25W]|jgi:hypothetical protein|uniref:Uncharacterized protein n=1 Tax=Duganella alba TaxID=2666081 RepID=A0A6L5QLD3_9BURK|nr:hypothetical protein [Duganella alba]MRX10616.1 hypothetical protein [Duganella alba]MRX15765.1 hypothetical protein [Duganella alba]
MKTTFNAPPFFALAITLSVAVVGAYGYLYLVNPEHPPQYLMAVGLICFAWTMRRFVGGCAGKNPASSAARRDVTLGIVFACLLLGVGVIGRLGWIDEAFRLRSIGLFAGSFVMLLANVIPKQTGSACSLAVRRAGAWALVLGGLGYALAWLTLPLAYASATAISIMGFAMAYGLVRVVGIIRKFNSQPPRGSE